MECSFKKTSVYLLEGNLSSPIERQVHMHTYREWAYSCLDAFRNLPLKQQFEDCLTKLFFGAICLCNSATLEVDKDGNPDSCLISVGHRCISQQSPGHSAPGDRGLPQLSSPGTQPSMDSCPFRHLSVGFTQSQQESQIKHPLTQAQGSFERSGPMNINRELIHPRGMKYKFSLWHTRL